MSRCLAEMMPTVTEPPSPNGLPIAITQSPTFMLVRRAERDSRQRLLRRHLEQREIGLGVLAEHLVDLELRAVVEVDDDLVGAVDDVIVGDDQAFLAVDHEAGAERRHLAVAAPVAAAARLKKSSKNSSNGEPFGTCGSGTPCGALDRLAGRDVDDGIDQLLGERGDRRRSDARQYGRRPAASWLRGLRVGNLRHPEAGEAEEN